MIFMKVTGSIMYLIMQIIMEIVTITERMNMLVIPQIGVTEK